MKFISRISHELYLSPSNAAMPIEKYLSSKVAGGVPENFNVALLYYSQNSSSTPNGTQVNELGYVQSVSSKF